MTLKFKAGALAAAFALGTMATTASAVPVTGQSDVVDNGGGSFTFIFDLIGADIDGNSDGLSFTNGSGLSFVATGTGDDGSGGTETRVVRQDYPADGGLGILGHPNGDNLGVGELLRLTFNQTVDILGFTFNDGHQDAANGTFTVATDLFGFCSPLCTGGASLYDGVGTEASNQGSLSTSVSDSFAGVSFVEFGSQGFTGYLESITVSQVNVIPLPAGGVLLLSGLGLLGAGAARRRKKA